MKPLRDGIREVFLAMGKDVVVSDDTSIIDAGILSSMSILELINGLEAQFDIIFEEEDLALENFDSLRKIEKIVQTRFDDQRV
ncbi:MAG: acyl carrier protein [bacterium]|nr:acyl carrier protein [bacterium]